MNDYEAARKRARELGKFYRGLVSYATVITVLAIIDAFNPSDGWWFYWIALIWGFFLVKHAWRVFGPGKLFDKEWEERKAAELMGEKPKHTSSVEDYFDEINV